MDGLKEFAKPPFANYDVVVYFGGGLFALPFINRYVIEPASLNWPRLNLTVGGSFSSELVTSLSLLFSIYILGHALAYTSSQFIEKLADRLLGKISTAILVSAWVGSRRRNEMLRALIYDRVRSILAERAVIATIVRGFIHLPVIPLYVLVYIFGVFGYYNTRVPQSVIAAVRVKLPKIGLGPLRVSLRTKWYKPLEHYVINRFPVATARMYNYLIISGLFRSLCIIFLMSLWAQIYYLLHFGLDGDWLLRGYMGSASHKSAVAEYVMFSAAYMFSFFSYLKFQRRYAEEAIFAFVLSEREPFS